MFFGRKLLQQSNRFETLFALFLMKWTYQNYRPNFAICLSFQNFPKIKMRAQKVLTLIVGQHQSMKGH